MSQRDRWVADGSLLVPRRTVLRGGLAGLAAAMMSRTLPGCDGPTGSMDGGPTQRDGGPRDAGTDAGPFNFPPRDVPPRPALRSLIADIGPLGEPDANGLRVAEGFRTRIIAQANTRVADTDYEWHVFPDGGATYPTDDGGWIYVSNSEMVLTGGVGAVRFDASGAIVSAYPILTRTSVNCAGGITPWHTWLSCEEIARGRVFECDPWGELAAVERPALGVFKHEAAAIDPVRGHVYLSEDERDGCFYRFVPDGRTADGHLDLNSGRLEVASVDGDGHVQWLAVPDPRFSGETPTRMQVAQATLFRGGEGLWYHEEMIYLATKGDDRVWAYDTVREQISILYDRATAPDPILRGVDNLTVSCCGDVLVAEDGGSMQVVCILPTGELRPLVQVVGHDSSEITGPAFDPSGTRLYFSSQRGMSGTTYEVEGPFHEPA